MAASNPLYRFTVGDQPYTLDRSELTTGVLRTFKQEFGPQYGKFLPFVQLLMEGDADAWSCAIWLAQRNAGEKPKPLRIIDVAVGDIMLSEPHDDEDEDGEDENPTEPIEPTRASTRTRKSSTTKT